MVQWRARSVSFFGTFLVLPMVLWSQPGKLAGVYFMTALALKEYHSLTASNPSLLSHTFQALSCLALIAASWFADYFSFCLVSFGVLSVHAAAWLVCLSDLNECHLHWLLGAAPATAVKSSQEHEQHETQLVTLQHLAAMLVSLAGLMIPFSFLHCMCLYRGQQSSMIPVWYTILVVTAADVGGLLGGHFGRALLKTSSTSPTLNCITPSISPSKSLSGLLLALLLPPLSSVMLFCLLQLFAYDECASVGDTPIKVSLGVTCESGFASMTCGQHVVTGTLIGMGAIMGDLLESLIKRAFKTKDTGTLLPGWGGVLDRLDSFVGGFPVAYYSIALCQRINEEQL